MSLFAHGLTLSTPEYSDVVVNSLYKMTESHNRTEGYFPSSTDKLFEEA